MYLHKNKSHGYCREHINERSKFKVKAYRELLPLWSFQRCDTHGFLNFDQVYISKNVKSQSRYRCKYCAKSFINSRYDPAKEKIKNAKKSSQKRSRELKCVYGITLEDYNQMLKSQNNSCAICGIGKVSLKRKSFDIDHCHETKKVRGLLCHACNVGIGFLKDDISILQNAITYLARSKLS